MGCPAHGGGGEGAARRSEGARPAGGIGRSAGPGGADPGVLPGRAARGGPSDSVSRAAASRTFDRCRSRGRRRAASRSARASSSAPSSEWSGSSKLHEPHPVALPPADPDQERDRSGGADPRPVVSVSRQSRGAPRRGHPGQSRQSLRGRAAGKPAEARGGRTSHARRLDGIAVKALGQASGQRRRIRSARCPARPAAAPAEWLAAATTRGDGAAISGSISAPRSTSAAVALARRCSSRWR